MVLDPLAEAGFGADADRYEAARPGWPAEAVDGALRALELGPSSAVLDLAAGTGKLTRELVTRVGRVTAVEPLEAMRAQLVASAIDAEVLDGTAEELPLADASVDAVFVGEAFHWFATRAAVAEMARVVRPGGGVALMWNIHEWSDEPWVRAVGEAVYSRVDRGGVKADRHQPEHWAPAFDGTPFGEFSELDVPHEQVVDLDGLVAHVCTWSFVRALPDQPRAELADSVRQAVLRERPEPGELRIGYRCQVRWARRQPERSS